MSQFRLETELDMAGYLDINYGHGVSAVYTNSGTSTTINIILNNEYVEQEEGIGVEALKPIAYCRTIDVPNIAFGNRLDVSAIKIQMVIYSKQHKVILLLIYKQIEQVLVH